MKITAIRIENFKPISNIVVSDLPNFIVLVGENGIGKSAVFEAISLVHSQIGPYSPSEPNMWSKNKIQDSVRVGQPYMKIELEIQPTTEKENQITNNKVAIAGIHVRIKDESNIIIDRTDENSASALLKGWSFLQNVGGIEFIPATRRFVEGQVRVQSGIVDKDAYMSERVSSIQSKYYNAKQQIVNFLAHDRLCPDEPAIYPGLKEIFETLLGRNLQVRFTPELLPIIEVETEEGPVNIDTLSSGQRELFTTYVGIHSLKLSNSVILFDEPDLHLHSTSQKRF